MKNIRISKNISIFLLIFLIILEVFLFVFGFGLYEENKKSLNTSIFVDEDNNDSLEILREEFKDSSLFETTADKVMFVAHPDDETLWGGNALYHEKYLVVCITCGVDQERVEEFKTVMNKFGDDYIMLSYPDLVDGKRSDWVHEWGEIDSDVKKILSLKDWDLVVTHNPNGEYGHIHHKITNKMVTSHANKDKLKYFGVYYYGDIPNKDKLYYLTEEEYKFKTEQILPLYVSQYTAIRNLSKMIHYESWISYNEWYGE